MIEDSAMPVLVTQSALEEGPNETNGLLIGGHGGQDYDSVCVHGLRRKKRAKRNGGRSLQA